MTDTKRKAEARTALSLARIKAAAVAKRGTTPKALPSGHWVAAVDVLAKARKAGS